MANHASINKPADVVRIVGRITRLKTAIDKAVTRQQVERITSLRTELERRTLELEPIKKALESL